MNRKGFTLIELILVIGIIGVILAFAIPNVTGTLQRNKKDQMIEDAKDMVEKARNYVLMNNSCDNNDNEIELTLVKLDSRHEILTSPYGKDYNREKSYVNVECKTEGNVFYVYLTDDTMVLSDGTNSLESSLLNSDEKYNYVNEE